MGAMRSALLVMLALLAPSPAQAQDADDVLLVKEHDIQLDGTQQQEVTQWMDDVREYRRWYGRYRNRIARNIFGFIGERRSIPAVPGWLPAKCVLFADFVPPPAGPLFDACDLLAYSRSNFTIDPRTQQALLTQKQNEQDPRSSFWKHLHLDAGWGSPDYRMRTYGVVGVHVTLPEIAQRVQVFLPPGFLLLSVPDGRGGREFQPAATIGVSIRMFNFEFPQSSPGTAHFNVAKAYFISQSSAMDANRSVDLVGLSFSWGR
jgi:hypothetical protein